MSEIGLNDVESELDFFVNKAHGLLEALKAEIDAPHQQKELRTWKIREVSELLGRSESYIRQNEGEDKLLGAPLINPENGRRYYTLERINFIRDKLKCGVNRPERVPTTVLGMGIFKGGCTKTTTSIHFGQRAALKGQKVLMIDLDPQGSLSFLFGFLPEEAIDGEGTLDPVLVDGESLRDHITPTYFTGIDIVKGSIALQGTELHLYSEQHFAKNSDYTNILPLDRLDKAIESLENEYDLIVIDFPPNLGMLTLSALKAINGLIIPITPSLLDYQSAIQFIDTFKQIRKSSAAGKPVDLFRLMISRFSGNKEDQKILSLFEFTFGDHLLNNFMVQSEEIKKAAMDFGTVYETVKPRGSKETYLRAIDHLNKSNDEILDLVYELWEKQAEQLQAKQATLFDETNLEVDHA